MTRHLTPDELASYRGRISAAPQQLLRMDRHLANCPECLAKLAFRAVLPTEINDLSGFGESGLHPAYGQLLAYVDDGSSPPELRAEIERHLLICASCAEEAGDLRVFSQRMAEDERTTAPAEARRTPWLDSLKQFFAARHQPGLALASFCLLVVGIGLITGGRLGDPAEMQGQIARPGMGHFPSLFYVGVVAGVLGLAGLLYRRRK